ncbi:MAG: hypothetical protein ACREFG_04300, partial [Chthoniobacterales bacterium]
FFPFLTGFDAEKTKIDFHSWILCLRFREAGRRLAPRPGHERPRHATKEIRAIRSPFGVLRSQDLWCGRWRWFRHALILAAIADGDQYED